MELSRRQKKALQQLRQSRHSDLPTRRAMMMNMIVTLGPAAMIGGACIATIAALGFYVLAAFIAGICVGFLAAVVGYNRDQLRDWPIHLAIIDWEKVEAAISTNSIGE